MHRTTVKGTFRTKRAEFTTEIRSAAVDRSPVDLVFVESFVQMQALEQELDHRRAHLRAIRERELLERGRHLGQLTDRACVCARVDPLADLEHLSVLEARDYAVE